MQIITTNGKVLLLQRNTTSTPKVFLLLKPAHGERQDLTVATGHQLTLVLAEVLTASLTSPSSQMLPQTQTEPLIMLSRSPAVFRAAAHTLEEHIGTMVSSHQPAAQLLLQTVELRSLNSTKHKDIQNHISLDVCLVHASVTCTPIRIQITNVTSLSPPKDAARLFAPRWQHRLTVIIPSDVLRFWPSGLHHPSDLFFSFVSMLLMFVTLLRTGYVFPHRA